MEKKTLLIFLGITFLLFVSFIFYFYMEKDSLIESESYGFKDVLNQTILIQNDAKESSSYLLMYLAFGIEEHRELFFSKINSLKENVNFLEKISSEDISGQIVELDTLVYRFEESGVALLDIYDSNPLNFKNEKYDALARLMVDYNYKISDVAYNIGKIDIIRYGLGVSNEASKVELVLGAFYWGVDDNKELYEKEKDYLKNEILYYDQLSLKDKENVGLDYELMLDYYRELDLYGEEIIKIVESGEEKKVEHLDSIIPYVEATSKIRDVGAGIVFDNLGKEVDILAQNKKWNNLFLTLFFLFFVLFCILFVFLYLKIKD